MSTEAGGLPVIRPFSTKVSLMSRFLATFLIVYSAMHLYAFTRVRVAFHPGMAASFFLAAFMVVTTCIPLIVRMVEQKGFESAARFFSWTGYTWMGFLFLF
ncbi:MAG: hypothetical protein OEV28_10585, partial [Nitrospirota bacterium]|nr:hypothetical protein [Nitrospirota bacterium]